MLQGDQMNILSEAIRDYQNMEQALQDIEKHLDQGYVPKTSEEAREQYYWERGYALDDIGLAARLGALRSNTS